MKKTITPLTAIALLAVAAPANAGRADHLPSPKK
jgi:hypothetical protein